MILNLYSSPRPNTEAILDDILIFFFLTTGSVSFIPYLQVPDVIVVFCHIDHPLLALTSVRAGN